MMSFNWWYVVAIALAGGSVLVGYNRTHRWATRKELIQPVISRYGTWARRLYSVVSGIILLTLMIVESLSGVMQFFLDHYAIEKDGEAWAFLLALIAVAAVAALYGVILNEIAEYCEQLGNFVTVSGEIILRERGRIHLRNGVVAIPRGERTYLVKKGADINAAFIRQLATVDTRSQDSIARDIFLRKLNMGTRLTPFEQQVLTAVRECQAENERRMNARRQAEEKVSKIVEENVLRPRRERQMAEFTQAEKTQKVVTMTERRTERTASSRGVADVKTSNNEFLVEGLTVNQSRLLACYLENMPRLKARFAEYAVYLEDDESKTDLCAGFMNLISLLQTNARFFEKANTDANRSVRFIIGADGVVKVRSVSQKEKVAIGQ